MYTAQQTMTEVDRKAVAYWLLLCCLMVFALVMLGGATRLTGSGLSMVRWEPIAGVLPPMSAQAWSLEFLHYQQSPEFKKINTNMDVEQFKSIYWFEYSHRLLARTIGLVFFIGLVYFWVRRRISRRLMSKLWVAFVLGGLQGVLGWYMVMSGLVDNPHVSQYRLTAHLSAALLIYLYMLWIALDLLRFDSGQSQLSTKLAGLSNQALWVLGFVLLTLISGGFVAGLKAGLIFNTFPKMGGSWLPDGMYALQPFYLNWFENLITVQFNHRVLAITTLLLVLGFCFFALREINTRDLRLALIATVLVVVLQVGLGISTLLLVVPIGLAVSHQGVALLLITLLFFNVYELRRLKLGINVSKY